MYIYIYMQREREMYMILFSMFESPRRALADNSARAPAVLADPRRGGGHLGRAFWLLDAWLDRA